SVTRFSTSTSWVTRARTALVCAAEVKEQKTTKVPASAACLSPDKEVFMPPPKVNRSLTPDTVCATKTIDAEYVGEDSQNRSQNSRLRYDGSAANRCYTIAAASLGSRTASIGWGY